MNHMQGVYVTGSAEETKELAKEFAGKLKRGSPCVSLVNWPPANHFHPRFGRILASPA